MIGQYNRKDLLIDFEEVKVRPKNIGLIVSLMLVVVIGHFLLLFDRIRYSLLDYSVNFSFIYFVSIIIVYPVIGIIGFFRIRKYGWYISLHYLLSSLIFWLTDLGRTLVDYDSLGIPSISRLLFSVFVIFSSVSILIYSMRDRYLEIYDLNRTSIFLLVLMTIFLPILLAGILAAIAI